MEPTRPESEELQAFSESIKKILEGSPNETAKTRVSGGVGSPGRTLVNLHNQRFFYLFSKNPTFSISEGSFINPTLEPSGRVTTKLINSGSTWQVTGIHGFNLYVRKKTIEIRYLAGTEKWYYMQHGEKGRERLLEEWRQANNACKLILRRFIDAFGGKSDFQVTNHYWHTKAMDDGFINKLPADMKFNTSRFQKVYNEQNIEILTAADALNYLENMGAVEVVPSIVGAINGLARGLEAINPVRTLKRLIQNYPEDLFAHKELVLSLNRYEKRVLSDWCWEKFGIQPE